MKFRYGDSWERFPIEPGEVWCEERTSSRIAVCDIFDDIPEFMNEADMIYTDPPWNTGNLRGFYTKSGSTTNHTFEEFCSALARHIHAIAPSVCYLEIGSQNRERFIEMLSSEFRAVQFWRITYYRKNPCWLVRGADRAVDFDFTGMDDAQTPFRAIMLESPSRIADLCTGRGLTGIAALKNDTMFLGTELNKRRLAVLIDKTSKHGARWMRCDHTTLL